MFDLKALSECVALFGSALSSMKSLVELLPKTEKQGALQKLQEVEEKLQIAQAQMAQGFGYELCKCTWPPQIMLRVDKAEYGEIFRCPVCGRVTSPDDMPPMNDDWRVA